MAEPMSAPAPLTIALPKGRLAEDALAFLEKAGYAPPANGDGSRKLILDGADGRLRFVMVKPGDVPTFVEYGAADLGIAGLDVVRETERDVYEPLQLPFGYCRLVICGKAEHADRSLWLERSPRVATKFPRLTEAYFRRRGLAPELIVMSGSVELAPLVGLTDLIVDSGADRRHPARERPRRAAHDPGKPGRADRQPGELSAARGRSARAD